MPELRDMEGLFGIPPLHTPAPGAGGVEVKNSGAGEQALPGSSNFTEQGVAE